MNTIRAPKARAARNCAVRPALSKTTMLGLKLLIKRATAPL
jgi:hypothetical protein